MTDEVRVLLFVLSGLLLFVNSRVFRCERCGRAINRSRCGCR